MKYSSIATDILYSIYSTITNSITIVSNIKLSPKIFQIFNLIFSRQGSKKTTISFMQNFKALIDFYHNNSVVVCYDKESRNLTFKNVKSAKEGDLLVTNVRSFTLMFSSKEIQEFNLTFSQDILTLQLISLKKVCKKYDISFCNSGNDENNINNTFKSKKLTKASYNSDEKNYYVETRFQITGFYITRKAFKYKNYISIVDDHRNINNIDFSPCDLVQSYNLITYHYNAICANKKNRISSQR